jgi:methylenetetrahydrofolate dehydrogenase (NADP+)/methenyltetrahydrofolate cyclohydrolase
MKIIDGKKIAAEKLLALKEEIADLDIEPALAVILVGDDPASHVYVKLKAKAAKEIGIELRTYYLDADASADIVMQSIDFLNYDTQTHGIIVQLPLPDHLDAHEIVSAIDPAKDVDGFHPVNQSIFLAEQEGIYPVFPGAIMTLIASCGEDLHDKNAVVLGKSDVFDRVMTHALLREGCVVDFICCTGKEKFSVKEKTMIGNADIVVTAIGRPESVSCDLIADGAIVIDGGINEVGKKIVGDVARSSCEYRDITLAPVPGGVGPVTIACLLENVTNMAKKQT